MKNIYLATAAIAAVVAAAVPASAAVNMTQYFALDSATNSAGFGATQTVSSSQPATAFTDTYIFSSPISGSGAATTIEVILDPMNYLNLSTVKLNTGATVAFTLLATGDYYAKVLAPVVAGVYTNTLTITGNVVGTGGTYNGNIKVTAAVPEIATWGMMVLGFGAIGGALRTSRRKVVFA